jgi:tetratricopeptide (TPR) repeat protein
MSERQDHYNTDYEKTGYSETDKDGTTRHYDNDHNLVSRSETGSDGMTRHYDTNFNITGRSETGSDGITRHYDNSYNLVSRSETDKDGVTKYYDEHYNVISRSQAEARANSSGGSGGGSSSYSGPSSSSSSSSGSSEGGGIIGVIVVIMFIIAAINTPSKNRDQGADTPSDSSSSTAVEDSRTSETNRQSESRAQEERLAKAEKLKERESRAGAGDKDECRSLYYEAKDNYDEDAMRKYMKMWLDTDDPRSAFELGHMKMTGQFFSRDVDVAIKAYRIAIDQWEKAGDDNRTIGPAYYYLGKAYLEKKDDENRELAKESFKKAVELGYKLAQSALDEM